MRIKTEYSVKKEMESSVGATWALADGTYNFTITGVRTSKGGNAMFSTTTGFAMVGAILKASSPKAKELLVEADTVSYDIISLFTMSIKDKSIMKVDVAAPVAAPVAATAKGKKK